MISQELIASVVDEQVKTYLSKSAGTPRVLLDDIPVFENFATIITGLRRCGKSTLMRQILEREGLKSYFLNFDDIRLSGFEMDDLMRLNADVEKRNVEALFFDELQLVKGWELFVNQKLREGYKVFISGSNASLLSSELGTHLTGRHLSSELFPFSYSEFLTFLKLENSEKSFLRYLKMGGMPEFLKLKNGRILLQLVEDILHRDIAVRYNVRDVNALRQLTVYLISNIGKPTSAGSLVNLFGLKSRSTISEYFGYLKDTYLLDFLPMFDYSIKKQIRNPKKVYAIDLGIYHQIRTTFTDDFGRQLENAVFLHLRRHYEELFYFNNNGECDFVSFEKGKVKECVQVCYNINDENMQREMKGLLAALNYFEIDRGVIVTLNQKDTFTIDGKTVDYIPAYEYFDC